MTPPRARTPRQLPDYWFGEATVPLAARALSALYAGVTGLRRRAYAGGLLRARRVPVPVLVVGNISVGGTGKTPLTIAVVERLRAEGWNPGVASRGYGRVHARYPRWIEAATSADDGGDEPVLIARRTGARVRVDRDRVAAAQALAAAGCDIVVCDDGLQHYRLARDLEVEVIDGQRRYGNGRLLPAGPLREPPARAASCDFRVVNLGSGDAAAGDARAGFGEWPMRLRIDGAQPMQGGKLQPLAAFAGLRVHAIAGIGHPERFFSMLRALGIAVVPHAFADHHRYVASDLQFGSDLPVLMTEKDAVKLASTDGAGVAAQYYSVPVWAELPEAFWVGLLDRLPARPHRSGA
jgi:tetraacyldisaccharide 4'-kinase